MTRVFYILLIAMTSSLLVQGQCLLDQDFETTAPAVCSGSPDFGPPGFGITTGVISGSNCLGFHPELPPFSGLPATQVREFISMPLSAPMVTGQLYDLSFFQVIGRLNNQSGNFFWQPNLGNDSGYIKVWGGFAPCDTNTLIYASNVLPNEAAGWVQEVTQFSATAGFTHLVVAPLSPSVALNAPYMLIDDVLLCEAAVLPSGGTEFSAVAESEGFVSLRWETLSEVLIEQFTLERSRNLADWEDVFRRPSRGDVNGGIYQGKDLNPHAGISYYRLREKDTAGNLHWSEVKEVLVSSGQTGGLTVYPNPVEDQVTIVGKDLEQGGVMLFNAHGETVGFEAALIPGKGNALRLDLSSLPSGIYLLKTKTNSQRIVLR